MRNFVRRAIFRRAIANRQHDGEQIAA